MRHLVRMALLALAVVAGLALPAAAESGDNRHWFESGPRHYFRGEEASPARVTRAQRYYDEEAAEHAGQAHRRPARQGPQGRGAAAQGHRKTGGGRRRETG